MPLTGFKSDLHIHTVLSPCGDLEMSPTAIVDRALERGLDMIAISDHNTTRQVKVTQKVGKEKGLFVLGGVEVTSQEEAHCLCFFETDEQLDQMQACLDEHLPKIPNDEERFGYQLIVDDPFQIALAQEALPADHRAGVHLDQRAAFPAQLAHLLRLFQVFISFHVGVNRNEALIGDAFA